ncbi:MAG: hypothetical protein H6943_00240 [Zoogloeaceae bacterium]|nr:hypothetical protein [Zoogloeaceae bacterium]
MSGQFDSLWQLPTPTLGLWGLVLLFSLFTCAVLIRAEGRYFRRIGRVSAWLKLRLASLPILILAVLAVVVVFSIFGGSGMEALAIAYLVLLTIGPLVHFGLHWQVGKRFGLRSMETAWIAFSGLFLLAIIPGFFTLMQPMVNSAARVLNAQQKDVTPVAPSPFAQISAQPQSLPNGEIVWAIHYQAPAEIRLLRIDMETTNHRARDVLALSTSTMCRRQNDIHLLWPADRPVPILHVFWKNAVGTTYQSTWAVQAPGGEVTPMNLAWSNTSVTLPVAISREALSFSWERQEGPPVVDSLRGSSPYGECAPSLMELPTRSEMGLPAALRLRTDHSLPKGPTWADFERPLSH